MEAPQQMGELECRKRLAEIVTLHFVAMMVPEERHLLLGFDTFGNDLQVEAVSKRYHGAGNGGVVGVGRDIAHERLINLEMVEREPFQVTKAGLAGAEVVDG